MVSTGCQKIPLCNLLHCVRFENYIFQSIESTLFLRLLFTSFTTLLSRWFRILYLHSLPTLSKIPQRPVMFYQCRTRISIPTIVMKVFMTRCTFCPHLKSIYLLSQPIRQQDHQVEPGLRWSTHLLQDQGQRCIQISHLWRVYPNH
jgi:hypothetical protein